jgi:hypothetical protein
LQFDILSLILLCIKDEFYEGSFINDQLNGFGTLENKIDSSIYVGTFLNGKKYGEGKLKSADG